MCIPFSLLGGWICYRWARDLYGLVAGFAALSLWCFSPNILGHGSLITPDVPAAAFGVAACYCFRNWLIKGRSGSAILFGFVLGLAQLSKFTWLCLYLVLPVIWLTVHRRNAGQLLLALVFSVWVINWGYVFESVGMRLGEFQFASQSLGAVPDSEIGVRIGNRFEGTWLGQLPVPLPANMIRGIDQVKMEYERGYWSYLRGEHRHGGWWYYYLYAMLVKMPVGTLGLIAMATVVVPWIHIRHGNGWPRWQELACVLGPSITVIALVSSQTGFNHHLRYVLPAFPFLFIYAAGVFDVRYLVQTATGRADSDSAGHENVRAASHSRALTLDRCFSAVHGLRSGHWSEAAVWCKHAVFGSGNRLRQIVGSGLVAWCVLSSLCDFPHGLSYFNEFAGGPSSGWRHLGYSNIDWGQDLPAVKAWIAAHPAAQPLYVLSTSFIPHELYGINADAPQFRYGSNRTESDRVLPPGWYVIGINNLLTHNNRLSTLSHRKPDDQIAYSMWVYHCDAE